MNENESDTDNSVEPSRIDVMWEVPIPLTIMEVEIGEYKKIKGFDYDPKLEEIFDYILLERNGNSSYVSKEVLTMSEDIEQVVMQQFLNDMNSRLSSITIEDEIHPNNKPFTYPVFAIYPPPNIKSEKNGTQTLSF